jgi:hypothetical protein
MKPLFRKCPKGGKHDLYQAVYGLAYQRGGKFVTSAATTSKRKVWACSKCGRSWGRKPPRKMRRAVRRDRQRLPELTFSYHGDDAHERLNVAHGVIDRVMVMLGLAHLLPALGVAPLLIEPCPEVADPPR